MGAPLAGSTPSRGSSGSAPRRTVGGFSTASWLRGVWPGSCVDSWPGSKSAAGMKDWLLAPAMADGKTAFVYAQGGRV